ncbi:MAG: MBOAT family O-acyltransferase [bacterium]
MFENIDLSKISELLLYNPAEPLIFSTSLFLFLFFVFLGVYRLFGKNKNFRLFWIILFSLYFYYKSAGFYFILLIVSAITNFLFGRWIASTDKFPIKRLYLLLALITNLGLLAYFKYTNFIFQIVADISQSHLDPLAIFLPIGISFYTFKSLNYVFDVYYDTLTPTKSFRDFCVFVFFFPNILAGPIDRASDFLPQVEKDISISREDLGRATLLIITGLIKKVIIADYIGLNFIDRVFDMPARYTGFENLMAVYGYTLQIYCDFSGYTDLALAVALMMGFKMMDNFNNPFKANSIADFWRRWHLSLSKWLLDYLFRPIQIQFRNLRIYGNIIGLLITFLLCGLWHGAGWNFILWGLLHGFFMSFALLIQKPKNKLFSKVGLQNTKVLKVFQIVITFHLVAFSFLFFRLSSLSSISEILNQIFFFFHAEVASQFVEQLPLIFILMLAGYLFHFLPDKVELNAQKFLTWLPWFGKAILIAMVIWIAAQFKSADIQPFIYFQF